MAAERCRRFFPHRPVEGAPHAGVEVGFVDVGVAGTAGGHTHVLHRVVKVEVRAAGAGGLGACFTKRKKPSSQQGKKQERGQFFHKKSMKE